MHPTSGVLKTVSATSGVRHGNGTVTSFLLGLMWASLVDIPQDSLTPVRIRPRRKEVTVPLPWRTPEVADTVFSTPDDGCMTPETCRVTWQRINVYILSHRVGPLLTVLECIILVGAYWRVCMRQLRRVPWRIRLVGSETRPRGICWIMRWRCWCTLRIQLVYFSACK